MNDKTLPLEPFENQVTKEDLYAPRPNKWRCSTVGCTYCDPDNYDGWEDEASARQQVDYDYIQCSIAKSDHSRTGKASRRSRRLTLMEKVSPSGLYTN
jgi:hypothetical protein